MRRSARFLGPALAASVGLVTFAACGARTGLDIPLRFDATVDATHHEDAEPDAFNDAPLNDGHPLDVEPECAAPTYCKPNDPNYIYKCGERVFECGSLQQCETRCGDAGSMTAEAGASDASSDAAGCHAECINPCLDTLGENTSNGCEFYPAEMDMTNQAAGVCYAVFIVNQWKTGEPAKVLVDYGGVPVTGNYAYIPVGTGHNITYKPVDLNVGIPKDEVAILFLSRDISQLSNPQLGKTDPAILANCPAGTNVAFADDRALHGTGIGQAFHIRTNVPVVAYQMLPYGGGSARITGATLLLPTNVWANNYVAANAYRAPIELVGDGGIDAGYELWRSGPSLAVFAKDDDTHVTINPVTAIVAGPGVPPTAAGQPITYTLDQGQYVQVTQFNELSGSAIQSDKPIAVIGASTLMDIPVTRSQRADHGEQMLPPVRALGHEYVGVRYRTRSPGIEESVPWRIVGVVDGTVLTFDPPQAGGPTTIGKNQVAEFDATGPFVVTSQGADHPFYFAQYMTGGLPFSGVGDPEYVNVITPAQFLPRYTFFTDPTYPETNLVVTRVQDPVTGAFPDVTLDCAGKLGGWQGVGGSTKYQFTRIDLSSGNFLGQNGCNNGVHTITGSFVSEAGGGTPFFGVTIWGWGNLITDPLTDDASDPNFNEANPNFTRWVSYAYPAGANITKLNDVVLSAQ